MSVDQFYPESETIKACPNGLWQIGMMAKLEGHLQNAKAGNRDSESRLVNRIGQIRRHFPKGNHLQDGLYESVKKACRWLGANGRTIDLLNEDPAKWISQRGGAPRW